MLIPKSKVTWRAARCVGLLGIVFVFSALLGCTRLTPYRSKSVSVSAGCVTNRGDTLKANPWTNQLINFNGHYNYEPSNIPGSIFSVIEFDDMGEMWDRNELADCIHEIRRLKEEGHSVTLIAFVHGWNSDASDTDEVLKAFKNYIEGYSLMENSANDQGPRRYVVGVYLAWRGKSVSAKLPQLFTFWSRKNAASRVAGIPCTEAILSLIATAKPSLEGESHNSKVIIIGHSFGGLIVEKAVTQAILGSMLLSGPTNLARMASASQTIVSCKKIIKATSDAISTNDCNWVTKTSLVEHLALKTLGESNSLSQAEDAEHQKARDYEISLAAVNLAYQQFDQDRKKFVRFWKSMLGSDSRVVRKGLFYQLASDLIIDKRRADSLFIDIPDSPSLTEGMQQIMELNEHSDIFAIERCRTNLNYFYDSAQELNFTITNSAASNNPTSDWPPQALEKESIIIDGIEHIASMTETNAPPSSRGSLIVLASRTSRKLALQQEDEHGQAELLRLQKNFDASWLSASNEWRRCRLALDNLQQKLVDTTNVLREAAHTKIALVDPSHTPADLVLLINPAVEALTAKAMTEAMTNELIQVNASQKPWIVAISSHGSLSEGLRNWLFKRPAAPGDWYTDALFPFGNQFTAARNLFRNYDTDNISLQRHGSFPTRINTKTLDNTAPDQERYFLHTAPQLPEMCNKQIVEVKGAANPLRGVLDLRSIIAFNSEPGNFTNALSDAFFAPGRTNSILHIRTADSPSVINKSAYWIISCDKDIIPDHANIFQPNLVALTAALVRINQSTNEAQ